MSGLDSSASILCCCCAWKQQFRFYYCLRYHLLVPEMSFSAQGGCILIIWSMALLSWLHYESLSSHVLTLQTLWVASQQWTTSWRRWNCIGSASSSHSREHVSANSFLPSTLPFQAPPSSCPVIITCERCWARQQLVLAYSVSLLPFWGNLEILLSFNITTLSLPPMQPVLQCNGTAIRMQEKFNYYSGPHLLVLLLSTVYHWQQLQHCGSLEECCGVRKIELSLLG